MDSNDQNDAGNEHSNDDQYHKHEQAASKPSLRDDLLLLVLGDGDFSYSFDLARYLATKTSTHPKLQSKMLHLVATGLDSMEALSEKYKDSTFLLKNLKALGDKANGVCVSVHHEINAVRGDLPPGFRRAHHVLFNHPHLGEENAPLHAQFLCHLFHSVSNVWMVPEGGFFHITLVKGQYERWKCEEAAKLCGMELVGKHPFRSPRVSIPYFQHRRHQTGRSFAARAPQGSETYTFVRKAKEGGLRSYYSNADRLFSAALLDLVTTDEDPTAKIAVNGNSDSFQCPHCDKSFREERSRKKHMKSVHDDTIEKKRKRHDDQEFPCNLCTSKDGSGPRVFKSAEALEDHRKAKHLAEHKLIQPDWHKKTSNGQQPQSTKGANKDDNNEKEENDFCDICGAPFPNKEARNDHIEAFTPSDIATTNDGESDPSPYQCAYCNKAFREQRAQKQHENFCYSRVPATS